MKKGIIIGILLCLCLGAASKKTQRYWQDTILKPEQAWIEAYGYNNESVLAYNIRSLIKVAQQQEIVLTALKKELDALTNKELDALIDFVSDPNEVKE